MKILAVLCLCIPLIASAQIDEFESSNTLPAAPEPGAPHAESFWKNKVNRTLVATEFSTRMLDAYTSHYNATSSCHCTVEVGTIFGIWSMKPIVKNEAADYSFFVGVAAGTSELSSWLWNARPHRHPKFMHAVSRLVLAADSGVEGVVSARNCTLMKRK